MTRSSVLYLRVGLLALPLLAVGFVLRLDMGIGAALLAALLLVTLPCMAVAQLQLMDPETLDRMSAYLGSAVTILILAGLALGLGWQAPGLDAMGLGPVAPETLALWTAGLTLGGLALMTVVRLLSDQFGWRESPVVHWLMPQGRNERMAFAVISATAGLGEEITYRGFLIPLLGGAIGAPWTAAALTSLSFGVLHAYQGAAGMVRAALLGFAFAATFLITGSLWPAIISHAIINLVAGLLLGEWLLNTGEE